VLPSARPFVYGLRYDQNSHLTKTDELLERFCHLNVWRRKGERAPHKPLLILLALGRLQAGADRLVSFDQIETPLSRLLDEFGPPRKSPHPELPFFHLQTDGVWEIEDRIPLRTRQGSKNPLRTELRNFRIGGGFPDPIFTFLKSRPEAVRALARQILEAHFPESLHDSILTAVGLRLDTTNRGRREPGFRASIISAWGHRCAFCGYSVQLDHADLGLEAAHILWCQAGGPDSLNHGLACCSLHHQAFDRGGISIDQDYRILVSSRLYGAGGLRESFVVLSRQPLQVPNRREALPKPEYLKWHNNEVFRGLARD
jgi:putative restriction endonuclease